MKTGNYKNKKFILNVKTDVNKLEYGDLIKLEGEYITPSQSRNYKGFNYREYLKTKKIYGTIKIDGNNIVVLEKEKLNSILIKSNNIRNSIIEKSSSLLPEKTSKLLIGILLGDKSGISEEIIENFKISNLSHILSVSGAHTSYIILGLTYILNKSKITKKWVYIITILILCVFMFITNFTFSVIRACLMTIITIIAKNFYKKSDITTSIAFSLLITLMINPFSINEIGLQLSYLGTIGIILFNKNVENFLNKVNINNKISKILSVTISAQIMIMPIMAYKFNTISLTFFISNMLASPILGIIMVLGVVTIFVSFISFNLAKLLAIFLNLCLNALIIIAEVISKIPFSNILIKTPYIIVIILIYVFILGINYIYTIYNSKMYLRKIQRKIIEIINSKNVINFFSLILILIIILNLFSYFYISISKTLKIYFVDVGQGDCTLIVTPNNKKILIDGGEGKTEVLLSYLLDRRIKTIDYIVISHFDSDHCNGLIDIIDNLNVKNIIISKQAYFSEEYINIARIINKKKINVIHVKQGDNLKIDKQVKIDILYPTKDLEYEDLNNNSIVAKISYNNFKMLFTRRH
ncbi:MAG: ComEC/Rec2 family competence protein [Clostridia bacterium]|nr:ComEC/Rec2 family competence protein [Clostridia bacterium]